MCKNLEPHFVVENENRRYSENIQTMWKWIFMILSQMAL